MIPNLKPFVACAAAAFAVLAAAPAQRQSADFARILAQYRGTEADRAVRELASWPQPRESREAPRLTPETVAKDPWSAAALAALHLESGVARWGYQTYRPDVPFHLGQAIVESLVAVARQTEDARLLAFCKDWYVAANTSLREPRGERVHFELGPNAFESPRRRLGDDPEILTLFGADRTSLMGPEELEGTYIHSLYEAKTIFAGRWYSKPDARDAAQYFRQALALNPELAEARVRLGRVLQIAGDPAANDELVRAADSPDNVVAYLAHLFLGQGHGLAGRSADAHAAYRAAIARYPAGTVARLALSQALFESGETAEAWTASRSVFARETMLSARDPWAAFAIYNFWKLDDRYARLRAQVSATPWRGASAGPAFPRLVNTEPAGRALAPETTGEREALFRTSVEAVRLETLVTDGGRAVRDLTPDDFLVTDNGVPQKPERLTTTFGLHVALVVDTSRSVWPTQSWRQVEAGAAAVARALTPDDRLSVLTVSERLTLLAQGMPPDRVAPVLARIKADDPERANFTALWDAVFAASALVADAPGPALVVAISDGMDTVSWFDRRVVSERLQRLGITVDGVKVDMATSGGSDNRQQVWTDITVGRWDLEPLRASGGQIFPGHDRNLVDKLSERFGHLRAGYVLYYTPANTTPRKDGWHEVKVTLRPGVRGKVQARPGYYERAKK